MISVWSSLKFYYQRVLKFWHRHIVVIVINNIIKISKVKSFFKMYYLYTNEKFQYLHYFDISHFSRIY